MVEVLLYLSKLIGNIKDKKDAARLDSIHGGTLGGDSNYGGEGDILRFKRISFHLALLGSRFKCLNIKTKEN